MAVDNNCASDFFCVQVLDCATTLPPRGFTYQALRDGSIKDLCDITADAVAVFCVKVKHPNPRNTIKRETAGKEEVSESFRCFGVVLEIFGKHISVEHHTWTYVERHGLENAGLFDCGFEKLSTW